MKISSKHNTVSGNIPTILIIFGATGDLMQKKIIPALFRLHEQALLPEFFRVVGFSRRPLHDAGFHSFVRDALMRNGGVAGASAKRLQSFMRLFSYHR